MKFSGSFLVISLCWNYYQILRIRKLLNWKLLYKTRYISKEISLTGNLLYFFGTIIIDECHHIPAKTFRETIIHFNAWYLYGLTATPKRKNNDEKLIFIYIGDIIAKIDQEQLTDKGNKKIEVNIKETNLFAPFDYKVDHYETISQILVHDTQRNRIL
ncbi:MAG: hypothetical protein GH151_08920 [Bacteroidetes bacterium]|nr:hypothetical protein [Bacteroidota bacterium]